MGDRDRVVHIVVVGDAGVGKSSLINTLLTESFDPDVASVIEPVTIPREVSPENVTVCIVDTSSSPAEQRTRDEQIKRADVLVLVYSQEQRESLLHIRSKWFELFRTLNVPETVKVIVAGNKSDLAVRSSDDAEGGDSGMVAELKTLMDDHKQIETCLDCSAKMEDNVSDVFYYANKAVLHPTDPLYNTTEAALQPACVAALTRIFRLCDHDKDGFLSDAELNEFQVRCFDHPLDPSELDSVKRMVAGYEHGGVVRPSGEAVELGDGEGAATSMEGTLVSLDGFLFLHKYFICLNKIETTWTVLRKFGYTDNLELNSSGFPVLRVGRTQAVELAPKARRFLDHLFDQADADADGVLNMQEHDEFFALTPRKPWPADWEACTETDDAGALTRRGFHALWALVTLEDHRVAMLYLAYLGYPDNLEHAFVVTPARDAEYAAGAISRRVFQVFVLGAQGCGKTAFLRRFVNKNFVEGVQAETDPYTVVGEVSLDGEGSGKPAASKYYVVLREWDADTAKEKALDVPQKMRGCDLVVLLYDTSSASSFSTLVKLHEQVPDHVPVVVLSTMNDKAPVQQDFQVSPELYCKQSLLLEPKPVSAKVGEDEGFNYVFGGLRHPWKVCPAIAQQRSGGAGVAGWLVRGAVVGALAGGAYYLWKYKHEEVQHALGRIKSLFEKK